MFRMFYFAVCFGMVSSVKVSAFALSLKFVTTISVSTKKFVFCCFSGTSKESHRTVS